MVGYAASTVLRGIRWGVISTTLLGMVDASIGGKTGINHKQGKNLIGTFWHPSFVVCDLNYLNTLPAREILAGMGEILKYGGLVGASYLKFIQKHLKTENLLSPKTLTLLIDLGVKYKIRVVMADERETGLRMFLNLGHTFAHAIEKTLGYGKLLHGEAVIIGLLAAIKLSSKFKPKSTALLKDYEFLIVNLLGFVRYYNVDIESVVKNMQIDKKRAGLNQKFVLLKRPGKPFIAGCLDTVIIRESLSESLAIYRRVAQ
jgi:3-dehydroquinate synthase